MVKELISKFKSYDKCDMCCINKNTIWFKWESMITKIQIKICRNCAYRETFGNKNCISAKKNKRLEN